jgi:hypothetical protein
MNRLIPDQKILDYLLKNVGKSRFFNACGYTSENWVQLRDDLLDLATNSPRTMRRKSAFGAEYEIIGEITAPNGSRVRLRTGWIVLNGDPDNLRFVTAYRAS